MQSSTEYSAVDLKEVEDPESGFKLVYDPSHPDADDKGYVRMPDIEVINEMVDMMAASRAYEANVKMIQSHDQMTGGLVGRLLRVR